MQTVKLLCLFAFLSACSTYPPEGVYNIVDFGAKDDSAKINTTAIQEAIDLCSKQGGGTVIVPPGKYLTGSFFMKNNVELHLEMGATLFGSGDSIDYPHRITDTRSFKSDGKQRQQYFGLIMADGVENIAIRCDFVDIRGIEIYAHANANNDSLNIDECQDMTVSNVIIDADDDGLVFKSLGTRDVKNVSVVTIIPQTFLK